MQPGFAMLESGLTRSKNSINVAIKNLTDLGVSMLVFWAGGFCTDVRPVDCRTDRRPRLCPALQW